MEENVASEPLLRAVTLEELIAEGRLPSGHEFELMPDTVGIGLSVSEVDEKMSWRKKARQAALVCKSAAGQDIQSTNPKEQVTFMGNMLDADVVFLSLAWNAQNNGMVVKLTDGGGVNCPLCANPFSEIPFGCICIMARSQPASGPSAVFPIEVDRSKLPASIRDQQLFIQDPLWVGAKAHVPENFWTNEDVVRMNRVIAALRVGAREGGPPRMLSRKAEAMNLRMATVIEVSDAMDKCIPHFKPTFPLVCTNCGAEALLPFAQGL
jgi:hypothetical protein